MMSLRPTLTQPAKLLVFDWDGTLFDSTAIIVEAIQKAVADVGGKVPDKKDAAWVIGMGLKDAIAHIGSDIPKLKIPIVMARYLYHYSKLQDQVRLFDGTLDMLQALKNQGYLLAVATGKSRRGLNEAMQHTDLRGMFDSTRTADETAGKPDPLMLHEIMDELDVAPERTLMIGDTVHDLQLALNAQTASVAVSFGAHDASHFDAYHPLHIVHDTAELQRTLAAYR